jgi:hypothetical protein
MASLFQRFKRWVKAIGSETREVEEATHNDKSVLKEVDELGNAILTANEDETLSLRFAIWRTEGNKVQRGISKALCWSLNIFDKHHCDKVLAAAEKRKNAPPTTDA